LAILCLGVMVSAYEALAIQKLGPLFWGKYPQKQGGCGLGMCFFEKQRDILLRSVRQKRICDRSSGST